LAAKNLRNIDVVDDSNCFYRALAFGLHGDEVTSHQTPPNHARHFDAQFQAIFGSNNLTATDKDAIHRRSLVLATDREEVGEEAIKTAADWMQRSIEVYTSSAKEPHLHICLLRDAPATSLSTSHFALPSMSLATTVPLSR
jgi:hypothetical protein